MFILVLSASSGITVVISNSGSGSSHAVQIQDIIIFCECEQSLLTLLIYTIISIAIQMSARFFANLATEMGLTASVSQM